MDLQTFYFRTLTTIFAWLTVPLYPLCILTAAIDPPDKTEIFPAPTELPAQGPKAEKVTVPLFPTFRELFFLLVSLLSEMVLLCPYLPDDETKPKFSECWGYPLFAYHGFRALSLMNMEKNWIAAQEGKGLWHLKYWKVYYIVQIFIGVMVGLPLLFRLATYLGMALYHIAPIAYQALRTAYASLN